jgi:hypothetical protein
VGTVVPKSGEWKYGEGITLGMGSCLVTLERWSMSLRERLLIASSLILGLSAVGCGDGDDAGLFGDGDRDGGDTPEMDAGKPSDAGNTDSGKTDGGDAGSTKFPTKACGSNTCEGNLINNMLVDPCCVPDETGAETSTCGFQADDIKKANPTSPFTGCVPRDVPAASASTYCGEFWDQVEMMGGDKTNGGLDIASGRVTFVFDGCCLPSGECGAQIDTPRMQNESINSHLGCVSYGRLNAALNGADAGMSAPPAKLPFCNPATGAPPSGTATIVGQPKFVCGCGSKVDDGTGTFPCFNNLPTTVCGAEDPTAAQLAMIPEFLCGCPADITKARLPCMINVAESVCGTKQIDANSVELAKIPVFVCGEDPAKPTPLPTLKGVDPAVCGKTPAAADNLSTAPEFFCGCTANSKLPCLRNTDPNTCGGAPIDATSTGVLKDLPEYICGCGADVVDSGTSIPCMSHVEKNVCGSTPISTAAGLTLLPKMLCGCGDGVIAERCIANVPANLCGGADSTAALAGVPDSLCGCGEDVLAAGRPCLNNLPTSSCGGLDVPTSQITFVPASLCGCGASVTYDPATSPRPCLSKSAPNECGGGPIPTSDPNNTPGNAADDCYTGLPAYARGCGAGTVAADCIPNGSQTTFGCVQPAVGTTVAGQPKYACGCGVGKFPAKTPAECIPNIATDACGAADPTPTQLGGLPTFYCGCGATVASRPTGAPASRPCFSYLDASTCGALAAPPATPALALPQALCGCGTGVTYNPLFTVPCLSKTAETSCGSVAAVITDRDPEPDCLAEFLEYQRGCGVGVPAPATYPSNPPRCVSNAPTLFGCNNVTSNISTQPSYLCGCGENVAVSGPCLPNVGLDFCGTIAFNGTSVPGIPDILCGCGATTTWNPQAAPPCLSKLATSVCGAVEVCQGPFGTQGSCATGQLCVDSNSNGKGDACVTP